MSKADEEHTDTERILKRVRPQEPSAELKGRVMRAAQGAWRDAAASVPWQIPFCRLVISAAAAAILISLANLYSNCATTRRATGTPTAGYVEPCDLDVMMAPHLPLARYAVTAGRPVRPDASSLVDHLEMVRKTLAETERGDASDEPVLTERRSRLFQNASSRHS